MGPEFRRISAGLGTRSQHAGQRLGRKGSVLAEVSLLTQKKMAELYPLLEKADALQGDFNDYEKGVVRDPPPQAEVLYEDSAVASGSGAENCGRNRNSLERREEKIRLSSFQAVS